MEDSHATRFNLTGCYLTHHGITGKRFFSFHDIETFHEISTFDRLKSEMQKVSDKEIQERQAVRMMRFFAENHPSIKESITGIEFIRVEGGCF